MRAIRSLRLLLEALYQDNPVRHKSAVLGRATVSPDKLERAVFTGLCEARENGITEKEFQRQKGKSIGGFLYAFNSLEFIASTSCPPVSVAIAVFLLGYPA